MTRMAPALALVLLSSCTAQMSPAAAPPPGATPSMPMPRAMAADSGVFAIQQGGNDVFTERFTRTDDRVQTMLAAPGTHAMIDLVIGPGATVTHMDVRQFSGENAPQGTLTAEFRGDSVLAETATPGAAPQVIRQAVPAGTIPYVNPSVVLMEQIVRRARAVGGSPVQVPVWLAAGGGQSGVSTVTFEEGGARFTLGPVEVHVTLDEQGRVTGGAIPSQGLTLVRREAGAPDPAHEHH